MLDFRKSFLAVAGLALAAGSAFAQNAPLSCVAQSAGTPSIRAEGVTELVGDVIISCSGGTPSAFNEILRQVNFQVFTSPSINITSRNYLNSGPGTNTFSEALLFIDEPSEDLQTICGGPAYPYSIPVGSGQTTISGVCGSHAGSRSTIQAPFNQANPNGTGVATYDPRMEVPSVVITVNCSTVGQVILLPNGTNFTCSAVNATQLVNVLTYRGNAYQARQTAANSLIWQGIPFDPPGSLTTRVIRMTNIRVNASQLGVPAGSQAAVQLVISTSASGVGNPIAVPITNPTPTVAIAQPSLSFSVIDPLTCLQCESTNKDFSADPTKALAFGNCFDSDGAPGQVSLRWSEVGFPSAFRRRNAARPAVGASVPPTPIRQDRLGVIYQTESGYMKDNSNGDRWPLTAANTTPIAGTSSGVVGLADHGTRLMARFANVQNGVQIWVGVVATVRSNQAAATNGTQTLATGVARLIVTDPNGAGPFSLAVSGSSNLGGIAQVSVVGGAGSAVYEIIETDTTAFERVDAPLVVAYTANTSANLPSLGTSTANGNYAPISTTAGSSTSAPIPRFVDTAANRNLLTINSCRTNILFPFVSNQAGFDTGVAIANTSKDPFSTSLQTGACTVNFYGTVGTSKVCLSYPSPSITGGEHFVWSLSSGGQVTATAGFQGYIIAQCQFQYGHGFAFISDLGAQRLAMGYLALVMDGPLGTRTGSVSETLGH